MAECSGVEPDLVSLESMASASSQRSKSRAQHFTLSEPQGTTCSGEADAVRASAFAAGAFFSSRVLTWRWAHCCPVQRGPLQVVHCTGIRALVDERAGTINHPTTKGTMQRSAPLCPFLIDIQSRLNELIAQVRIACSQRFDSSNWAIRRSAS